MWLSVKKKEKEKEKEKRKREWYDDIKIAQCHRCLRFADITMVHGWPTFAVLSISYIPTFSAPQVLETFMFIPIFLIFVCLKDLKFFSVFKLFFLLIKFFYNDEIKFWIIVKILNLKNEHKM
jgi:hypothetical protein